jgi:hypothetical protein
MGFPNAHATGKSMILKNKMESPPAGLVLFLFFRRSPSKGAQRKKCAEVGFLPVFWQKSLAMA